MATEQSEARSASLLRNSRWVSVYILFFNGIKVLRGVIIPKLLEPASYGLWSSLNVLIGYSQYADLGAKEQVAKRLPYYDGAGDREGRVGLERCGAGWEMLVGSIAAAALIAWSFLYAGPNPEFYRTAFRLLAAFLIVQRVRFFGSVLLQSRQAFRPMTTGTMVGDGAGLVLAVVFLLWMGVIGLVWALLASEVIVAVFYLRHLGFIRPELSAVRTWPMIREGMVLLAVMLSQMTLMMIDQIFFIAFFSRETLGLYSLGLVITTMLLSFSAVFLTVIQPRVMHLAGLGRRDEIFEVVNTSLTLYMLFLTAVAGFCIFAMDMLVKLYLTKYTAGIEVYVLMPALAVIRGLVILYTPFFISLNREKYLVVAMVSGIAVAAAIDGIVVMSGGGMTAIAIGTMAGYGAVALGMAVSFEREGGRPDIAKYALMTASIVGVAGVYAFYSLRQEPDSMVGYAAEGAGAALVYTAWMCLFIAAGRKRWAQAWRHFKSRPAL